MTFDDLKFEPHPLGNDGIQATVLFDNGYGASVIRGLYSYGGLEGLYELAVIKAISSKWYICYDSGITDDVIGHLTPDDVTGYLQRIKEL